VSGAFDSWYGSLFEEARQRLARRFADEARGRGVFVVKPDGSEVAIPPILTPAAIPVARMQQASADARRILSGLSRITVVLMTDDTLAPLQQRLFGAFLPLEAEGLHSTWRASQQLATARVDYLVDPDGRPRALEVNATIPAMQGYSDCVAEAFVRAVAEARGLDASRVEALLAKNGRNTDELLASLVAHHQRLGGEANRPLSIAIVARRGDAQRGELEHYACRWAELGHQPYRAHPEDAQLDGGRALVAGRAPDLIYRHIFARRLDPASDFARICLEPERHHVFNPIASHLEVKGMLGLLSEAADDDAQAARFGLSAEERDAVRRSVPWTRVLEPDRFDATVAEGERLVLKRSWDYGGKSVFLGADFASDAAQARAREVMAADGPRRIEWEELVRFALADRDAWVVQELVHAERRELLRVGDKGAEPRQLYLDLSTYTNLGDAPPPTGGAVRASESRIVNILGGGGLAPLLLAPVVDELLGL
jgi:hypothetical protein